MITHKDHFHGSDLEKIEEIYGVKKEDLVSFSANVNPLGISPLLKASLIDHIDAITTYPDRDYTSLRKCIAKYVGTEPECVIVGNGSTELISLFIQVERPKKAVILGPTYSEYEREIALGGGTTLYYPLKEEMDYCLDIDHFTSKLSDSVDLLVLCNPNNPTSTAIDTDGMRRILDVCKEHDIYVMVDETYVEFCDQVEKITSIPLTAYYNNIIILRGTSKFFAAPGLRLGYAVTGNMDLIKGINQRKNPWTINSLAAAAGELMFTDTKYISDTRNLILSERRRMYERFLSSGCLQPYRPSANFILAKITDGRTSQELFDRAIRRGMMIRDCSTFPFLNDKFIRVCVMSPTDNDRLMTCLLEKQ